MVTMASASTCLFLFAFVGYPFACWGCKPSKEENITATREWKMMMSDAVAHGIVVSRETDPSSAKGTYSVLFEVRCSYKGEPLPELIRIRKVGYNPDNCLNSSLIEGPKYLVYLKEIDDGQYVQQFRHESGESQYVEEITVLCEASVEYPIGKNMTTAKEECPEKYMYDDCVPSPPQSNPPYDSGDHHAHSHDSDEAVDQKTKEKPDGVRPSISSGENQKHSHGSEETVDQKTKEKSEGGQDISEPFPASVGDGNDSSSVTITLNMGALILLLLAAILPL